MNPNDFKRARRLFNLQSKKPLQWYRIVNKTDTPADVYIYDEIGYFGITADTFVNDIRALNTDRINLHLNTPGGEVFDGIGIYNALRDHPAQVHVTVDALAASIGSVIAMAGDRIIMNRNSNMMIHDGSGFCMGNAADMRKLADMLDKTSDNIASIYAERTGSTAAEWRNRMRDETWYTAQEAVTAGLADEVAGTPPAQPTAKVKNKKVKAQKTAVTQDNAEPADDPDEKLRTALLAALS